MTPNPKRDGVSFVVQGLSGFEAFLFWLLPRSLFARWCFRYLRKRKMYFDWIRLPDGSEWDKQCQRLSD